MMNIYTGNVILDGSGAASVQLPEWFEALNGDFRYQLTAIGAAAPNLHIAQEVTNHHSALPAGLRHESLVAGHRRTARCFRPGAPAGGGSGKAANERGFYVHPALYGEPDEKQIGWGRNQPRCAGIKSARHRSAS